MAPEQITAVYDAIHSSQTLSQFASTGNDAAIATQLNLADDSIMIQKESIPSDYLRAMAIVSLQTAVGLGDEAKIIAFGSQKQTFTIEEVAQLR